MKFFLPVLAVILVGCVAKAPDSRIEAVSDLPLRWHSTPEAKAGIDTRWVSRVGGSRADSLVREALRSNPDMRIAEERVIRAVSVAKTAAASMNPQVSAGLDGGRQKQIFVGFPFGEGGVPSSISENFGGDLSVSWEPDIWGFNRAGQASLIADAQAEGNALRAARASLAAQVMRAWLALVESNEQIALSRESGGFLKATLEIVRDRFANALTDEGGSAAQFRLAESEVANNDAVLAQRMGEREQAIRQLEVLMGRYPKGAIQSAETLPKIPPMPPAGLPSELLLRRPDILEAERRFASSGSLVKQAKLAFYPSFSITARGGTTTDSLRKILNSNFGVWSLAGSVAQPIWAGGAIWSESERIKSADRSNLARLQSTVRKAFGEVEQALIAERFLAAREVALVKALKSSIAAAEAAESDYTGGTGDALTLITAQTNRINLSTGLVSLRRLRLDNRITLHLALGGDYRPGK
ncbi:MAG: efflux transporter outer membrane subunit [Akkermansiaceae bacterium]|nr:efflux transporter outer membrane subunit [Akkermansiaceae bacterium]